MWPDVVVNDKRILRDGRFVLDGLLHEQHLRDIGHLEQVLVVQCLLRLDDARQVDQSGGVSRPVDLECSTPRVYGQSQSGQ